MDNFEAKKLNYNDNQEGVIYKDIPRFGDDRGDFINVDLNSYGVEFKRSYIIRNNQKNVVRAFHGHKQESKLLFVTKGAFKVILMDMGTHEWKEYNLLESVPRILYVPKGFYNGFVSLTEDSEIVVYSSSTMDESRNDDFRLPYDVLGKDVWGINNR